MKDEALSPVGFLMESLPIARPTDSIRTKQKRLSAGLSKSPERSRRPGGRFSIGFG